jgi:selenocysteine lyase/cysteine desulfurase
VLYRQLQQSRGIELRIVPHRDGATLTPDVAEHVDGRTRLVSVAWVSHQNGFRHDMRALADVAHRHGALLYTDAIQALGMVPTDVRQAGVDCLTSGTYKWLLGGFGVAPFYVRRELLERITVDRLGALHVEREHDDHQFDIYKTAKKFDYATLPFAEVYQLGAALDYLDRVGVARIAAHTLGLAQHLREGLVALGFRVFTPENAGSSIVSFYPGAGAKRAREALERAAIQVSYRENGTQIRVSPALFNTQAEIGQFLSVAKTFV